MQFRNLFAAAVVATVAALSMPSLASADTMTTLDFTSGTFDNLTYTTYTQDGYTLTTSDDTDGLGGDGFGALQFTSDFTVTSASGTFDVLSLKIFSLPADFHFSGTGGLTGTFLGTALTVSPTTKTFSGWTGLTSFTVTGSTGAFSIIDDLVLNSPTSAPPAITAVPLPASAMTGSALLGGLALARRRRA